METEQTIKHLEALKAENEMLQSRLIRHQEYAATLERENQWLKGVIRQLQSNEMDEVQ